MPQDWFAANAPTATPTTKAPAQDWFATNAKTTAQAPPVESSLVGDVLGGLRSSAARTVFGGGDLLRQAFNTVLPASAQYERVIQRPAVQAGMTAPPSTAGQVASLSGDVAQFFLPTNAPARLAKAAEIAKSGALTLAQTQSPLSAGVSAALTAAIPGGATLQRASGALRESAEKSMAQALGATKDAMKAEAARLAPQMLTRGVGGSRAAMLDRAKSLTATLGPQLDAAYAAATAAGETVPGQTVRATITSSADAFKVTNAAGHRVPIPGAEGLVQQLDNLSDFIGTLGDDIPVDRAAHLKRVWDGIVDKAGLFGRQATAANDRATAQTIKTASDSFRQLLNTNPTIDALNKELSFWTGLKKVLKETQKRTQAQSGGLVSAGMGGAGAIAGGLSGDSPTGIMQNAVIGGLAGRQLVRVVQSPAFRTKVSAPLKDRLADALASGETGRVVTALGRITASLPGYLRPAPIGPAR